MLSVLFWGVTVYFIYCAILFAFQRQLLFPRDMTGIPEGNLPDIPGIERIWAESGGEKVENWYIPPPSGTPLPAPLLIFAHGNAELIDFWPNELMAFHRMGMGLLLAEYPGYGRSQGSPSQESIARFLTTVYDIMAARRETDTARIVLMGRSLGGGAVCSLASARPSAALILMSAFTGIRAFAGNFLVPAFLVRDPFDNLSLVKNYPHPVLIIHGKEDEVIPYSHGRELYRAAPRGKMISYRCGHNDCPPNRRVYEDDVAGFLREAGILSPDFPEPVPKVSQLIK